MVKQFHGKTDNMGRPSKTGHKLTKTTIRLSQFDKEFYRAIGNGIVSDGIRDLAEIYREDLKTNKKSKMILDSLLDCVIKESV